jgi:hypothetical protein
MHSAQVTRPPLDDAPAIVRKNHNPNSDVCFWHWLNASYNGTRWNIIG